MNTEAVALNLNRKWRSKNFDQIVGQNLVIRILKNSLYLGHYFPVYLFAGQRGCGKTSTARVFATALNCYNLPSFQKDPKSTIIPCLQCVSCKAMQEGKHPDFIEIDAASYTGVDHMRNIIESSSLLPVMGNKRVYLIDEAHMLSKAAFNAALKILEEPPATALFILATTNPHKIIDTVRSRCFQLFFTTIEHDDLKKHLQNICDQETILYDDNGLEAIVRHTQGSARDALNMLEQVRFSSSSINQDAVLKVLGHMNDYHVLRIVHSALLGSSADLLSLFNELKIEQYAADFVWQRLITVLRALMWIKHGVDPRSFITIDKNFTMLAHQLSLSDIHHIIEILYEYEELFLKTPMQHALLEMVLLRLGHKNKKKIDNKDDGGSTPCATPISSPVVAIQQREEIDYSMQWKQFVEHYVKEHDSFVALLFQRAQYIDYDEKIKTITVNFSKDLILFKELLDNSRVTWQNILDTYFVSNVQLSMHFIADSIQKQPKIVQARTIIQPSNTVEQEKNYKDKPVMVNHYKKNVPIKQKNENMLDVSDESTWKIASMLLRHFPGVVTEIRENQ